MSTASASRTMRADNYALSEATKRLRDEEQARLTDEAFQEALRLLQKHRAALDRIALALLDKETLDKPSWPSCSRASSRSRGPRRPPARSVS